jgi:hypothetical protein
MYRDTFGTSYVVMNDNTLGFINPTLLPGQMGVLHGSVLKGGHNWLNGPVLIAPSDVLRPATLDDFKTFRVVPPPGFTNPTT